MVAFHCFISIFVKCGEDRNLAATHIRRGAETRDRNAGRVYAKVKCPLKISRRFGRKGGGEGGEEGYWRRRKCGHVRFSVFHYANVFLFVRFAKIVVTPRRN